jgi:hypothetical protein
MEPFATPSDVEAIWRTLTDQDTIRVFARIAQASRMVREQVPDVDARIAAGTLSADTVRDVVVDMVERVVSVDRFVRQGSVAVDDGSESKTYVSAVADGELFISPAQLLRLQGRSVARSRAFTIYPGSGQSWT